MWSPNSSAMYSMYHTSYYNGKSCSYSNTGFCHGYSSSNFKSNSEVCKENSPSSLYKNSPSSLPKNSSNSTATTRFHTVPRQTKSFMNSHKKWADKSMPNSAPTAAVKGQTYSAAPKTNEPSRISTTRSSRDDYQRKTDFGKQQASRVRQGSTESLFSSKFVDRKNDSKKNKLSTKKPENKENVDVKDCVGVKKSIASNQNHKLHYEKAPPLPRRNEFYSKQWIDSLHFFNSNLRFEQLLSNVDHFSSSRLCVKSYLTPMHRSLEKSLSMIVRECPEGLTVGSQWDELSSEIWSKFIMCQQCEDIYRAKIFLWEFLYVAIKACFPRYGLYLVGSTLNGFGTENSDIDLCLMIHKVEVDQRTEAQAHLNNVYNILMNFPSFDEVKYIHAKVPLLKFRHVSSGLYVDLNCNNSVGMRNTHLLYTYSHLDWRVRPLVVLVKLWAQCHGINDAKNMTLSSYSLSLMVINFLQNGVKPAVLPCLQKMMKDKFDPDAKLSSISIMNANVKPYKSENQQTLGELFLKFFQHYASFNFSEHAVSVRVGGTLPVSTCRNAKSPKNEPMQWKFISIEEPFDLTNTARSVHDPTKFQMILDTFKFSAETLAGTRKLESIIYLNAIG